MHKQFCFIFRRIRAPRCCNNVGVGSGEGTEGGWCEFGSHHSHIVESPVHSFTFTVFFELDQKSSLQGVLEEYTTFDDDCGLVKPL